MSDLKYSWKYGENEHIPSCARSPAFLSGIFQCAFCLPVSYPHTRHERIPGRDHLSRKSSSHKVLTEKHVLRGY